MGKAAIRLKFYAGVKIRVSGYKAYCQGRFIPAPGVYYPVWAEGILKTTNNLYTYSFNAENKIIEVREGCELKDQFDYIFLFYEKDFMKTIAYDNSKRLINVCHYQYGSNNKIEKMYSVGFRGSREETYFYENNSLQKIVIRQFDRNGVEHATLQHSFEYKPNGELNSIILSTELYSETIYQEK